MYILSDIFLGNFFTTQGHGANPQYYAQFGFPGHEGVDWGTPSGTPILAPFDGKIVKDIDDAKSGAYGIYVVCWDPIQKCAVWFCHLQNNQVTIDEFVHKGQILGHTGNTGNSTGSHLHVNFVETDAQGNRLNADLPYRGFLNILDPNLVEWKLGESPVTVDDMPTYLRTLLQENNLDLNNESQIREFFQKAKDFTGVKTDLENTKKEVETIKTQLQNALAANQVQSEDIIKLQQELEIAKKNQLPSGGFLVRLRWLLFGI